MSHPTCTTGLPGLDRVLKGILPGDNIVWQVMSIEDYAAFVQPYVEAAHRNGHKLVYFRFASHPALIIPGHGAEIHELHPENGFENFIAEIHAVIEHAGRGAHYVFDCLSELAADWYSDQMLGNFFMLTCPYLYDLETVAYFALFRDRHSVNAIGPITETTQLFLEVYRHEGLLYVRPIKVQQRYSSTMNLLHVWKHHEFKPVTSSVVISEILNSARWSGLDVERRPGFWERTFNEAQELHDGVQAERFPPEAETEILRHLLRMVVSREDGRIFRLASEFFTLEDLLEIRKRMIGTGLIGGKTVGMLLARAILKKSAVRFSTLLERQDSFYIGSDVFYSFLVRNGVWWIRQKQRNPATLLDGAEQARQRILTGRFPQHVIKQFEEILDYFGQSPFIVRSSSLLEDNFGNAFAGKYESLFCANQGPRERRIEDFLVAIRTIYASTMSEKALRYRAQRGMLDRDEQMALLIMRVSGATHGKYFYPAVAGVGFSFNPYVWSREIDPKAGVVRLVYGLGTRAVNRSDDDYTRIVALNAPQRRPETNFDEVRQYAQRRVDYIDLEANQLVAGDFTDVVHDATDLPVDLFCSEDTSHGHDSDHRGPPQQVLTFNKLLSRTSFVRDLRDIHALLQDAYKHPVDIEFAVNFLDEHSYRINMLQCRPLQLQGADVAEKPTASFKPEDRIIEAHSAVVGRSRLVKIDRFIYVVPQAYGTLPIQGRHEIARLLGDVNRALQKTGPGVTMALGPGRWGTSSPSLGIPVVFADIHGISILCEIVAMHEHLIPDVSLGTHFLNELVEMDMLYVALFPKQKDNFLNAAFFENAPNHLLELAPSAEKWKDTVKVVYVSDTSPDGVPISLLADAQEQRFVCFLKRD